MADIRMRLKTPSVPNYIIIESSPGMKQDGLHESPKVSICDLSKETLEEIAKEWREALFDRAEAMKRDKSDR